MTFAQFYHPSAIDDSRLIEACGDRAVIILDGRESAESHKAIAARECAARRFHAYRICKGRSFMDNQPTTGIVRI